MKIFNLLTKEQKKAAFNKILNDELKGLCDGCFFYPGLEAEYNEAWKKAEAMRTPWFFHEYLWDYHSIRVALKKEAGYWAKEALYTDGSETVIDGIA